MNPTPSAKHQDNQSVSHAQNGPVCHIPTDPKAFQRWLRREDWMLWPVELQALAVRALNALQARTFPEWKVLSNLGERRKHRANWSAFTTAYAEWVRA